MKEGRVVYFILMTDTFCFPDKSVVLDLFIFLIIHITSGIVPCKCMLEN